VKTRPLIAAIAAVAAVAAAAGCTTAGSLDSAASPPTATADTDQAATAYCTDQGRMLVERVATWNTNGDPSTWLTLAGRMTFCEFEMGEGDEILSPLGARLEPGEILVAPSTDPGWTPLFLTAGGLVMEMGGPNSHGAVVAREYGIPAVVGVADATSRLRTGELVTVDGAAGLVHTVAMAS
jgi:phosphohistidine swiveling domain-containing protein